MKLVWMIAVLSAFGLAGCASLEPEPCTADWVKWRTDAITQDFRTEFGPEMDDLVRFSKQLEDPSPLLLLEMTARLSDFQDMADVFSETVMPELGAAIDQCGTPTEFVAVFSDMLREQGVDGTVLDWVEETATLMERRAR